MEPVLTDDEIKMLLEKSKEKPKLSVSLKILVSRIKRWIRYGIHKRYIIID
jgi:hypothetical protein